MPTAVATAAAVAYSLFLSLASSALRPQTAADATVPTAVATAATAAVANSLSLTQPDAAVFTAVATAAAPSLLLSHLPHIKTSSSGFRQLE